MAYCDIDDIVREITEGDVIAYTNDTNSDSVNTENLNACIAWADDTIINPALRKNFDVPFDPVPPEIQRISIDLTVFKLYERRGKQEKQKQRYDRAMAKLSALKSGADVLDITPSEDLPVPNAKPIVSGAITGTAFKDSVLALY